MNIFDSDDEDYCKTKTIVDEMMEMGCSVGVEDNNKQPILLVNQPERRIFWKDSKFTCIFCSESPFNSIDAVVDHISSYHCTSSCPICSKRISLRKTPSVAHIKSCLKSDCFVRLLLKNRVDELLKLCK